MEVQKEGLKLDFDVEPPSSYYEPNNRTAKDNMSSLRDTVNKWESEEACVPLIHKPDWVSPMSVSIETDDKNVIKKRRPCIDLSRSKFFLHNIYFQNFI